MNDKRTRSDYIREIEQLENTVKSLERKNKKLKKEHDDLVNWLEDEIHELKERIKLSHENLGEGIGGYTLRMYLNYQKNAYREVLKRM